MEFVTQIDLMLIKILKNTIAILWHTPREISNKLALWENTFPCVILRDTVFGVI